MSGTRAYWKEKNRMSYLKIEKKRMTLPEAKDIENALAAKEKYEAFMEYVAICDHPEILEGEEVMEVEE